MRALLAGLASVPLAAMAGDELPAAPDYVNETAFAHATAEKIVAECGELVLDAGAVAVHFAEANRRLVADGFDVSRPLHERMRRASAAQADRDVAAFASRHGLADGGRDAFCAAGRAEMAEGSAIGRMLVEAGS